MFRHITCHPQGALTFLAKITVKQFVKHEHTLCEGCGSISCMRAVCATVPEAQEHTLHACTREFMICSHTLHTINFNVLQIVLPSDFS
jgi:hypothetical protein